MYLMNPPIMPKRTPPSTRSLNTTMPCMGPVTNKAKQGRVRQVKVRSGKIRQDKTKYVKLMPTYIGLIK